MKIVVDMVPLEQTKEVHIMMYGIAFGVVLIACVIVGLFSDEIEDRWD